MLSPSRQDLTRASLTRKLPSGIFPRPAKLGSGLQAGSHPLLLALGKGTQRLACPCLGQREVLPHPHHGVHGLIYSRPAHPLHRHCPGCTLLPSLAVYFLVPFLFIGQGEGEGTGKKRFTVSWGKGGSQ